jgi:hypothetical protein
LNDGSLALAIVGVVVIAAISGVLLGNVIKAR